MTNLNILIADDHPIFRLGLANIIKTGFSNLVIFDANTGLEALEIIHTKKIDIAILDINMPIMNGLEVCKKVQEHDLPTSVIILTMYKENTLLKKAKENGAKSYLIKDNAAFEVVDAITAVLKNEYYWSNSLNEIEYEITETIKESTRVEYILGKLTSTELKTLKLICKNYTSKEIGELLFINARSVDNNRSRIAKKLGLEQVTNSLLVWAMNHKNIVGKM